MILFSYDLSVFKPMILVYICIRILDLNLENIYENGKKRTKLKLRKDKRPNYYLKLS